MLKSSHILRAPEEILHQIIRRHGAAGFKHYAAVLHGRITGQQILVVELQEEIL